MKTREFCSDAEVRELVAAFEAAEIAPSQFTHAAHMATALWYLADSPALGVASERMRAALLRFTAHHGVNVYHETLTTFWMRLLDHLAANQYRDLPLWRRINLIVTRWGGSGAVETHYSPELIHSRLAREQWVPPDRLALSF